MLPFQQYALLQLAAELMRNTYRSDLQLTKARAKTENMLVIVSEIYTPFITRPYWFIRIVVAPLCGSQTVRNVSATNVVDIVASLSLYYGNLA